MKKEFIKMNEILGYDCDNNEIEEFRVLRFPDSEYIENWDEEINIDPRFYCLIKNDNDIVYAISIYDDYHRDYIKKYENISKDKKVTTLIKPASDMQFYQVAFSGITGLPWYYDRNKSLLKEELEILLNEQKVKKLTKKEVL